MLIKRDVRWRLSIHANHIKWHLLRQGDSDGNEFNFIYTVDQLHVSSEEKGSQQVSEQLSV